ncbi:MAG: hypothetical protein NVSMB55_22720 [Mycobacteriales bacterium]
MLSSKRARHARTSSYSPRHARPSHLPAKVAAAGAVGGILIPTAMAAPAFAAARQSTALRVAGPAHPVEPGNAPVSFRMHSGSSDVDGATVELQVAEGGGWRTVAKGSTGSNGLGHGSVPVRRDTKVRAFYRGTSARMPATSSAVTVTVDSLGQQVVAEASRHRGAPYRYGATGPNAFDCSGFTRYVYSRFGRSLPHNAASQRNDTQAVSRSDMRVGDLVFLDGNNHVGIYAGNDSMWDAPHSGTEVTLRRIYSSSYTVGRVA